MSDLVRVQIPDGSEFLTLAQLEAPHAEEYIKSISGTYYAHRVQLNILNCKSELVKQNLIEFWNLLQNAVINQQFRVTPIWHEGELQ